jgi:hypothetical protein
VHVVRVRTRTLIRSLATQCSPNWHTRRGVHAVALGVGAQCLFFVTKSYYYELSRISDTL